MISSKGETQFIFIVIIMTFFSLKFQGCQTLWIELILEFKKQQIKNARTEL